MGRNGHFVPGAAFELAAGFLFVHASPLLEEEGCLGLAALLLNINHPTFLHRAGAGAGFSADDGPIDVLQVQFRKRPEQRFEGEELHVGMRLAQAVDAVDVVLVLDADAHPDVRLPGKLRVEGKQAVGTLGEDLILMPIGAHHDIEDFLDVIVGDFVVEEVAHRVDEDDLGFLPAQWDFEGLGLQRDGKSIAIGRLSHRLQPARHALRIAMLAAGADLGTASDRVPGGFGPFD